MTMTEQIPVEVNAAPRNNRKLVAAAAIAAFTELVHVIGGGATIVNPLRDSALEDIPRLTLLAVWYIVTVAIGLSAVALFIASRPQHFEASRYLVMFISLMWIGFSLAFVWVAVVEGGSLITELNQPVLLMPVGVLGLWGLRNEKAPQHVDR